MESEITAVIIIEVLGRPAEHIANALEQLIERLAKEKDVQVMNKKIFPPKPTEKMFITFAEAEIKVKDITKLAEICFVFMPSSVEIIEPSDLKLKLSDANALLNFLVARLHNYDAIAKRLSIENMILQNKLKQVSPIGMQTSQGNVQQDSTRIKQLEQQKQKLSKEKKARKRKNKR